MGSGEAALVGEDYEGVVGGGEGAEGAGDGGSEETPIGRVLSVDAAGGGED